MINREYLLEVISGRRSDFLAAIIRFGLSTLTPIYRLAVAIRNRRFDRAARNPSSNLIRAIKVPVISIGNLTTGGTGKTPMVITICEILRREDWKVAIVSRGYGSQSKAKLNDEALELQDRLPDIPHLQSPDRFEAAQRAVDEFGSQIIVLDDGFQHRRLHRDLDIVLIDCTNPFGYDRLLPRGLLREPLSSLGRCHAIVLTRCELVSAEQRHQLLQEVSRWNDKAILAATQISPEGWLRSDGSRYSLEHLGSQAVFVICGIGNPSSFLSTVERMGLQVAGHQFFADHHDYSRQDMSRVTQAAESAGAKAIVCTHKDLVKVRSMNMGVVPIYSLLIESHFVFGRNELEQLVRNVAKSRQGGRGFPIRHTD